LGKLEKSAETLTCGLCSYSISCSPENVKCTNEVKTSIYAVHILRADTGFEGKGLEIQTTTGVPL